MKVSQWHNVEDDRNQYEHNSQVIVCGVFFLAGLQVRSNRGLLDRLKKYDIVTPHRLDGRHRREANTLTQVRSLMLSFVSEA